MGNKSGVPNQIISLLQGGRALHCIGEKFSPDVYTGKTRPTLAAYTAKHNQQVNKHAGLPLGALFAALVVSGLPAHANPDCFNYQVPFPATVPKSAEEAASTLPERIAAIANTLGCSAVEYALNNSFSVPPFRCEDRRT